MTAGRARRRGEPLVVLGTIMLCWIAVRIAVWWAGYADLAAAPAAREAMAQARRTEPARPVEPPPSRLSLAHADIARRGGLPLHAAPAFVAAGRPAPSAAPAARTRPTPLPAVASPSGRLFSAKEKPEAPAPRVMPDPPVAPLVGRATERSPGRRWSADAWVLVRGGGGISGAGPSVASYGGSQAGAVLRYRLAPGDPHRLTAYLRASVALNGSGEREAAAGLSVRPVGLLPLVVAAEGRVGRLAGQAVARPAVLAVTELAPMRLPAGARGELYLQAGYVGGFGATPFVDGQAKVDRELARLGPLDLRAGGGVWGGAQRGAARLDAGPSVAVSLAQGPAAARVALDWRFRVMGRARPASGPAVTISAGF